MKKLFNGLVIISMFAGVGLATGRFIIEKQNRRQRTHSDAPADVSQSSQNNGHVQETDARRSEKRTSSNTGSSGERTSGDDRTKKQSGVIERREGTREQRTAGSGTEEASSAAGGNGSTLDSTVSGQRTGNRASPDRRGGDDGSDPDSRDVKSDGSAGDGQETVARRTDSARTGEQEKSKPSDARQTEEREVSPDAEKKARSKLKKARDLMSVAKYGEAVSVLEQVPSLDRVRTETADAVRSARTKAAELKTVVEKLEIAPSKRLVPVRVEVRMKKTQRTMEGLLMENSEDSIRLRRNSATFKISKSEISNLKRFSRKRTREILRQNIRENFQNYGSMENYVIDQYYDRAKREFSNYLWSDGAKTLSRAYEKEGDNLYEAFRNMRAETLYRNYQFFKKNGEEKLAEDVKDRLLSRYPDHSLAGEARAQKVASARRKSPFVEAFAPAGGSGGDDDGGSSAGDGGNEGTDGGAGAASEGTAVGSTDDNGSGGSDDGTQDGTLSGGSGTTDGSAGSGRSASSGSDGGDGGDDASGPSSGGISAGVEKRDFNIAISDYPPPVRKKLTEVREKYGRAIGHYEQASDDRQEISKRKKHNDAAKELLFQSRKILRKVLKQGAEPDPDLKKFDRYLAELYGTCYRRSKMWGVY